jgi:hypothetical protein
MGWWERVDVGREERSLVLSVVAWAAAAISGGAVYAAVGAALWRAVAG